MEFLDRVYWNNRVLDYLIAAGLLVAGLVLAWLLSALVSRRVVARAAETEGRLDDVIAGVGARPVFLLVALAGLHAGIKKLATPPWFDRAAWTFLVIAWTLVGALFVTRLVNGVLVCYLQQHARERGDVVYDQVVRLIRTGVAVVVWVVAVVFVISNLGFNVSSLLAGLGLGGFALGLAAKDSLANLFGSLTIMVNGPFLTGDMVKYQGAEGTVEEIGLRDTRVRLFNGNLVVIPNSMAPTSVVENISRRPSFRVLFKLGVTYATTVKQIERAVELVRQAVAEEEGTAEKVLVHFIGFAESALEVQVIYWIEDTSRILDAQHGINRRIKAAFGEAGIDMAFPTVTVVQP